jgi:recombination protein RecR
MQVLPKALTDLIDSLSTLPGVGPRTAERYAYFLAKNDPQISNKLSIQLNSLHDSIHYCPITFALIEASQEVSPLYANPTRNKQIIAVVAEPFDIVALERIGKFEGTYHVLGALISPIDGIGPDELHIDQLLKRVKSDKVKEIILATNASVEGESTALYINKLLSSSRVRITRLARGLPIGVDLEYADQITLGRALEGRTVI